VSSSHGPSIEWGGAVLLVAGALAALGSFLPWIAVTAAFVGTIGRNGFDGGGDGIVTVAAGIVIALLGIAMLARSGSSSALRIGAVAGALVLGAVAVIDIGGINDRIKTLDATLVSGSVGTGLIVIAFAAVLTVIGAAFPSTQKLAQVVAVPAPPADPLKPCPQCGEQVPLVARTCPYCRYDFKDLPAATPPVPQPLIAAEPTTVPAVADAPGLGDYRPQWSGNSTPAPETRSALTGAGGDVADGFPSPWAPLESSDIQRDAQVPTGPRRTPQKPAGLILLVVMVVVAVAGVGAGSYLHVGPFGLSAAAQDWCAHHSVSIIDTAEQAGVDIPTDLAAARAELQAIPASQTALRLVGTWEGSHHHEFAVACESAFGRNLG
jgi:hypothetical protein